MGVQVVLADRFKEIDAVLARHFVVGNDTIGRLCFEQTQAGRCTRRSLNVEHSLLSLEECRCRLCVLPVVVDVKHPDGGTSLAH